MRLSHSTVTELLDHCAYRVGLAKVVKLPAPPNGRLATGIAFHAAAEHHERQRMLHRTSGGRRGDPYGAPLPELVGVALDALSRELPADADPDEWAPQALAAVRHWYATPIPEGQPGAGGSLRDRVLGWRPVAVEGWFDLWLSRASSLPIVGQLDAAYETGPGGSALEVGDEPGDLTLVDLKSAQTFGKYRLDGEGLSDQGTLYVLAAMRSVSLPGKAASDPRAEPGERGRPPDGEQGRLPRFEYHVARTREGSNARFEGSRVVTVSVDGAALDHVEERLGLAHGKQLAGRWDKNPDSWLCSVKWCPFHQDAGGLCDPHGPNEVDVEAHRG